VVLAKFVLPLCLLGLPASAAEPPVLSQEEEKPGGSIKLTRPDGTAIYVNPHAVAFVRGPLPGEQGHTTIVFASGAKQTVLESVEMIGKIMDKERGGK
jgi:uncharacterized protein YlzI (FlbEa/FlbD family)